MHIKIKLVTEEHCGDEYVNLHVSGKNLVMAFDGHEEVVNLKKILRALKALTYE